VHYGKFSLCSWTSSHVLPPHYLLRKQNASCSIIPRNAQFIWSLFSYLGSRNCAACILHMFLHGWVSQVRKDWPLERVSVWRAGLYHPKPHQQKLFGLASLWRFLSARRRRWHAVSWFSSGAYLVLRLARKKYPSLWDEFSRTLGTCVNFFENIYLQRPEWFKSVALPYFRIMDSPLSFSCNGLSPCF